MVLERLGEDDVKKVAKLLRESWKERGLGCSVDGSEKYVREGHKTEIKKDQFFAVRDGKRIVGSLALVCDDTGIAQIRDFVILKEARGRGLGREVVKEILEWCKQNLIRKVFGFVDNNKALLLRSCGFKDEGVLKDHFKKGESLMIMSLWLEKEEKQVDLGRKIEEEEVFKEASERLRKLPFRK